MKTYAYIRVSTKEQNIDRQLAALELYQIPPKNIFCDYQSGKDFQRPAYREMVKELKEGDVLIIKSIDRLGRNYNDILTQWQHITKDVKADIVVLDMNLLDTGKKDENLTGTLIADLVLQILAYVAQTEREFIHQRQAEGIAAAAKKLNISRTTFYRNFRKCVKESGADSNSRHRGLYGIEFMGGSRAVCYSCYCSSCCNLGRALL